MDNLKGILRNVMLFAGLSEDELEQVARICAKRILHRGEVIARQGEPGDELFIVTDGFAEVAVQTSDGTANVLVNLGSGQIIGEMALIDQGPRSATVRAISEPTTVQVVRRADFENLCEKNTHIGYVVMKDIAADLSFKLRQRNLNVG